MEAGSAKTMNGKARTEMSTSAQKRKQAKTGKNPSTLASDGKEYEELDSDEEAIYDEADELFDEHADSEDEQWVQESLLAGCEGDKGMDSVSCPGCFAQLSLQCQAHTEYAGQFRALFVTNCRVVTSQTLKKKVTVGGKEADECFRPVACAKCGIEVGVLDGSGVYHFCNVVY